MYELKGTLSLHGVERPLTVRAHYTGTGQFRGQRWGYEAKFTVKRSDFGMNYGIAQKVLGDEVDVTVSLELVAAK